MNASNDDRKQGQTNSRLEAALQYARRDWPVIALTGFSQLMRIRGKFQDFGLVSHRSFRLSDPTRDPDVMRRF
jgi:hypothetical protein